LPVVAARSLDDGVPFCEQALLFGFLDHVLRDPRLDRTGGVEELALAVNTLDLHHQRIPDGVEDAV